MTAEHWFALLLTLECVGFLAFDLWRKRRP